MPTDRRRRRNTVLAALEAFRQNDQGVTVSAVVCFLYVCENEGASITELASIAGLRLATASRVLHALAPRGAPRSRSPYAGLVEVRSEGPNRKSRTLFLTSEGRRLREHIDGLIRDAVPIL